MIERYSRPNMSAVWSDKNKYDKWLTIEIAVCEAWAVKGLIPDEDITKIREASYDFDIFKEVLKTMDWVCSCINQGYEAKELIYRILRHLGKQAL